MVKRLSLIENNARAYRTAHTITNKTSTFVVADNQQLISPPEHQFVYTFHLTTGAKVFPAVRQELTGHFSLAAGHLRQRHTVVTMETRLMRKGENRAKQSLHSIRVLFKGGFVKTITGCFCSQREKEYAVCFCSDT